MTGQGMDSVYCGDCLTRLSAISLPCPKCNKYTVYVYGKMLANPLDDRWKESSFEKHLKKNAISSAENNLKERRGF